MFSRFSTLLLATTAMVPLGLVFALANPQGPQVVGGSATVQGQGTPTVTVTQTTNSAIINWNTFNIGAGEKTNIFMPSSSSVQLDRVTGGLGPSQILGSLWSNGRVFLVNPDGILFGTGAKVDSAGFLATTNDIKNTDFMAGRYNFSIAGRPDASIVNQGTITAQSGGFAALVAPGVRNSGTISATLGTVALASGNGFTLDLYGDKLITLGVNDSIAATVKDVATGQPLNTLVKNDGKLSANGGRVELTAAAARTVVDSVINNTGVIEANSIGTRNGMIVLSAAAAASKPAGTPTQKIKVSGKLSAAGKNAGETGGKIQITGEAIEVTGAKIDATGIAGGGKVLIGGDVGGGNPSPLVASLAQAQLEAYPVPTATSVIIDATTTIDASAISGGNGGKVVVWSDGATSFNGTILARGGANGGNGGFVETSGHQSLSFNGTVDLSAPQGQHGTLLLDPMNATIDTNPGDKIITVAAIESALATGGVIVSTAVAGSDAGDITAAASVSWANASTLTLSANRNITINNGVTIANTGAGNLALRADSAGTGVGTVNFIGTGKVDFSQSTGLVSIFYNPTSNPAGSVVNSTSYKNPTDYSPFVLTNGAVPNQLTAYMLVNTVYDLQNIQNNLSGTYALGKNIDAIATAGWNNGAGFVPIGNPFNLLPLSESQAFVGLLDGDGHTINSLTINSPKKFVGLFSLIGSGGIVRNLGVTNANVSSSVGNSAVGVLAGENWGLISSSYATGTATGPNSSTVGGLVGDSSNPNKPARIERSYANVSVTGGAGSYVGGLIGFFTSNDPSGINQSYATGSVFGDLAGGLVGILATGGYVNQSYATGAVSGGPNSVLGGLVGGNFQGIITNSYSTGSVGGVNGGFVMGGLVGINDGFITGSLATGAVSGTSTNSFYFGGLIGEELGTTTSSYWDTQTTGQSTSAGGIGLTTTQLKAGLPVDFDPTVWGINATINNGYPYLLWQVASAPSTPTILTPTVSPPPPPPPPPPATVQPSLPPDFTDIFGTGQTNSFNFGINTQVAGSTVSVLPPGISLADRINRGVNYIGTSSVVRDAVADFVIKWGALATGGPQSQQVAEIIMTLQTAMKLHTDDYLTSSGVVIGILSEALLEAVGARIGSVAGPQGAIAGKEVAGIIGDSIKVAGAVVVAFGLGFFGSP